MHVLCTLRGELKRPDELCRQGLAPWQPGVASFGLGIKALGFKALGFWSLWRTVKGLGLS